MSPAAPTSLPNYANESGGWASNAVNPHHCVDFRRPWVPSPERSPAAPIDVSLPGIEEQEREYHLHRGAGSSSGSRRTRTRGSSRTYGGEEHAKRSSVSASTNTSTSSTAASKGKQPLRPTSITAYVNTHPGDESSFTETHPHTTARSGGRTRPSGREQEHDQGRGSRGASCERRKSWLSVLSPKKIFSAYHVRLNTLSLLPRSRCTYLVLCLSFRVGRGLNWDLRIDVIYCSLGKQRRSVAQVEGSVDSHPHNAENREPRSPRTRAVTSAEWKAYGMWARPMLGKRYGDVVVRNASACRDSYLRTME